MSVARPLLMLLLLWPSLAGAGVAQPLVPFASPTARAGGNAASRAYGDAVLFNPAALVGLSDSPRFILALGHGSAGAGGDLLDFEAYRRLFNSDTPLTRAEILSVLDSWIGVDASSRRGVESQIRAVPLSAAWVSKDLAVSVSVMASAYGALSVSRGLTEALLVGTRRDAVYPAATAASIFTGSELRLAAARRIGRVQIGVGVGIVSVSDAFRADLDSDIAVSAGVVTHAYDLAMAGSGAFEASLRDETIRFEEYLPSTWPLPWNGPGRGIRGLLGLQVRASPRFRVGASYQLPSRIRLTGAVRSADRTADPVVFEGLTLDLDRLRNEYDSDVGAYAEDVLNDLLDEEYATVLTESEFSVRIPGWASVGIDYAWSSRGHVQVGFRSPWSRPAAGFARASSLQAGVSQRLGIAVLEVGLGVGNSSAARIAGGLSLILGRYQFGLAASGTPRSDFLSQGADVTVAVSLAGIVW